MNGKYRPIRHGTAYAYQKRNCRCPECIEAARKRMSDYRHRKRCNIMSETEARKHDDIIDELLEILHGW